MLGKYTETLGRCGGATPQRLFLCSWQGEWYSAPTSLFAGSQFCSPQYYCRIDPGSRTDTVCPVWFEYRRCQSPICGLALRLEKCDCLILVQLLPLSASVDFRQQGVESENCFRFPVTTVFVQPQLHPAIVVCVLRCFCCRVIWSIIAWFGFGRFRLWV